MRNVPYNRAGEQEPAEVGRGDEADPEDRERHQRFLRARLPLQEERERADPTRTSKPIVRNVPQPDLRRLRDRVDEHDQSPRSR